jgi:hypothetical protein
MYSNQTNYLKQHQPKQEEIIISAIYYLSGSYQGVNEGLFTSSKVTMLRISTKLATSGWQQ